MMSSNDFLFSQKVDATTVDGYNNNPEVVPIILNEFQPAQTIYLSKIFSEAVDGITSGTKAADIVKKLTNGILGEVVKKNTSNIMAELVSRNPNLLYNLNDRSSKIPNPIDSTIKLFANRTLVKCI